MSAGTAADGTKNGRPSGISGCSRLSALTAAAESGSTSSAFRQAAEAAPFSRRQKRARPTWSCTSALPGCSRASSSRAATVPSGQRASAAPTRRVERFRVVGEHLLEAGESLLAVALLIETDCVLKAICDRLVPHEEVERERRGPLARPRLRGGRRLPFAASGPGDRRRDAGRGNARGGHRCVDARSGRHRPSVALGIRAG